MLPCPIPPRPTVPGLAADADRFPCQVHLCRHWIAASCPIFVLQPPLRLPMRSPRPPAIRPLSAQAWVPARPVESGFGFLFGLRGRSTLSQLACPPKAEGQTYKSPPMPSSPAKCLRWNRRYARHSGIAGNNLQPPQSIQPPAPALPGALGFADSSPVPTSLFSKKHVPCSPPRPPSPDRPRRLQQRPVPPIQQRSQPPHRIPLPHRSRRTSRNFPAWWLMRQTIPRRVHNRLTPSCVPLIRSASLPSYSQRRSAGTARRPGPVFHFFRRGSNPP